MLASYTLTEKPRNSGYSSLGPSKHSPNASWVKKTRYDVTSLFGTPSGDLISQEGQSYRAKARSTIDRPSPPITPAVTATALTVKDMVEKIRLVLGLNGKQIANLVGVSRPALYTHTSRQEPPKDLSAYRVLHNLAVRIETNIASDLSRGLKTVLIDGKTLLEHINELPLDEDHIFAVARRIHEKLSSGTSTPPSGLSLAEQRRRIRLITKEG